MITLSYYGENSEKSDSNNHMLHERNCSVEANITRSRQRLPFTSLPNIQRRYEHVETTEPLMQHAAPQTNECQIYFIKRWIWRLAWHSSCHGQRVPG
jgi:hypothetical protein